MKIHLAGDDAVMRDVAYDTGIPWVMTSYYYHKTAPTSGSGGDWKLDYRDEPECLGLMADSGAFTFIGNKSNQSADDIDWHEYAESYANWVRDNEIERWIELDLDTPLSVEFSQELRDMMEDIVGWDSMPVWHPPRGKSGFRKMAREYNRVCVGGFPWREIPERLWPKLLPWFIKTAHKHNARIHALGFQPRVEVLNRYPFDSTDSANWMWNTTFGTMYEFTGDSIRCIEHDKEVTKDMYYQSLRAWARFAHYMDGRNEVSLPMGEW